MGFGGWIVVAILVLVALYAIIVYNRLVRLRALVREGFSGITVQLRRRADLVPNLVRTVEGYATHERQVLNEVTEHRTDPPRLEASPRRRRPTMRSAACSAG
jgi:LemA protein